MRRQGLYADHARARFEAGQLCRPLAWLKVLLGRPVLVAGLAPIS